MTDAQEFDLQASTMPSVTIYSDGSFKPNLNTGGYGTIMICNGYTKFLYGGFVATSNNAMELHGAISGLRLLTVPCRVNIISDSKYVVDGLNWMTGWAANNWKKSDGGPIKNEALWREMYYLSQRHIITATWVKGHSTSFGNSVCDNFASIGAYNAAGIDVPPNLLNRI